MASELLAALVDPPEPLCPDKAIVFLSHRVIVGTDTASKGETRDTKILSEARKVLVLFK